MTAAAAAPAPGAFAQPRAEQTQDPTHLVLANTRTERSLWPAHIVMHSPAPYEKCAVHLKGAAVAA